MLITSLIRRDFCCCYNLFKQAEVIIFLFNLIWYKNDVKTERIRINFKIYKNKTYKQIYFNNKKNILELKKTN